MTLYIYAVANRRILTVQQDRQAADAAVREVYGEDALTTATSGLVETYPLDDGLVCHIDLQMAAEVDDLQDRIEAANLEASRQAMLDDYADFFAGVN